MKFFKSKKKKDKAGGGGRQGAGGRGGALGHAAPAMATPPRAAPSATNLLPSTPDSEVDRQFEILLESLAIPENARGARMMQPKDKKIAMINQNVAVMKGRGRARPVEDPGHWAIAL